MQNASAMSKSSMRILMFVLLVGLNFNPIAAHNVSLEDNGATRIVSYEDLHSTINDCSQIPTDAILSSETTPQVFGFEPIRLQPTHGGRTDRHFATNSDIGSLQKKHCPIFCRNAARLRSDAASPRFFYVIALRRILC